MYDLEKKEENMENERELNAELKLEDLEGVAGGVSANRPTGMPCPQCGGFIPTSMEQIMIEHVIECPHCGLRLRIN